jgi:hypothetical protein
VLVPVFGMFCVLLLLVTRTTLWQIRRGSTEVPAAG